MRQEYKNLNDTIWTKTLLAIAGFEDGSDIYNTRSVLECGKGKELDFFLQLPERNAAMI